MIGGLLAQTALACGGFFCDNVAPVNQAGEQVVFAVGGDTIEMHVQVQYQGPSEEFSWLLPVPQVPELLLSSADLFGRLNQVTTPLYVPTFETTGRCAASGGGSKDDAGDDSDAVDSDGGQGVTVVGEQQVGPYDAQILTASDVATLTTWLVDNGYDVAPGAEERLAAYVSEGSYFVGLKLRKDRGTGDLAPVALRFAGGDPMIPLALTAVAVTDDMPLQPFVLGAARAVPENYLHVTINPFAVDWLQAGSNYLDVVSRAADEAGGQAFATDFAGGVADLGVSMWTAGQYPVEEVAAVTDSHALASLLFVAFAQPGADAGWMRDQGAFPVSAGTMPILARFVPRPPDYPRDDTNYLTCLRCAEVVPVDGAALAAALAEEWVEPMRNAQALLDAHPWLTRMTSSMSADEMTLDPRFVLNDDLPAVPNVRGAVVRTLCSPTRSFSGAPRELVLDDGRVMALPSAEAWIDEGWTWETWTAGVGAHAAETVEQTGRSGAPTMMTDNRDAIDAELKALRRGCGCDGGGAGPGLALATVALGLVRRRRP